MQNKNNNKRAGESLIEYAIVAAVIAVVSICSVMLITGKLQIFFNEITSKTIPY